MSTPCIDEFTSADTTNQPALRVVPQPRMPRTDSLLSVRVAPLVRTEFGEETSDVDESAVTETVMDMQLIVDYTGALAKRTASCVKSGEVHMLEHPHRHPEEATCLRCAVIGTSHTVTLSTTLLEILARSNADEDWNSDTSICTDIKIISRLRRLAVSAEMMQDIYGPHWGQVMLMCLRAEAADFSLLQHLVRQNRAPRILTSHSRYTMAAFHLGMVTCPWSLRDGSKVTAMLRNSVAVRLAVAAASIAEGNPPAWVDHLPAPEL